MICKKNSLIKRPGKVLLQSLPIQKPRIEYFINYRFFRGINGELHVAGRYVLRTLPAGEPVAIIAFTKD